MNVENPIPISIFFATPSAKTVHGVTPYSETTKTLSPKPKINNPKQRKKKVLNLGLKSYGFIELQETKGTELTRNILEIDFKLKVESFII